MNLVLKRWCVLGALLVLAVGCASEGASTPEMPEAAATTDATNVADEQQESDAESSAATELGGHTDADSGPDPDSEPGLTLGLPDLDGAPDIDPAPLGTFIVARADAGIRRQATADEPSRLEIPVYETPFGPPRVLLDANEIDAVNRPVNLINWPDDQGVRVMRVIAGGPEDDWLVVQAPVRPNNSYVWVRRSDFDFGFTDMRIEIDLVGGGTLTLFDGDDQVLRSDIVHGHESRPTPTHLTYIETGVSGAKVSPAYGTAILSMASFSEALGTFAAGGLPSNFLHGTNHPELMGQQVSSGEIRVPNEVLDEIVETIPPGTPVLLFDSSTTAQNKEAILEQPTTLASTVNFAEGTPGAVDNATLVTPQLWRRCGPGEDRLLCRSAG